MSDMITDFLAGGEEMKRQPSGEPQVGCLEGLQSDDMRRIMDNVDNLRKAGLAGELNLPQIVVCGDQSSGKSSVLEALTQIPFPRKESLCTRFATEIILRLAKTSSIAMKIIPSKMRSEAEKRKLESYKRNITDYANLPDLIEEATELMGLTGDANVDAPRAFSRDVLSIEISGPNKPQLTLVDLPGLIHAENKSQGKHDVELIHSLVEDYIANDRTIILAVVSAKNDYANQIILTKARDFDPKGKRTLGIITKPDYLERGSENEKGWIDLAQNSDIFFELGWHLLRNRANNELSWSFAERNRAEDEFFSQGSYQTLNRNMLGISALRDRLSRLLYEHLKRELPQLHAELESKLQDTTRDLTRLGEARSTVKEQRRFLVATSIAYQQIVDAAVNGHYEDKFFGTVNQYESILHDSNMKRLRAVIQYLNGQFARQMCLFGAKFKILDSELDEVEAKVVEDEDMRLQEDYAQVRPQQLTMTQVEAVDWVKALLQKSRGRELSGNFNPLIISQLFWQQSEAWETLAWHHVQKVGDVCNKFVRCVLNNIISDDVSARLQALRIDDAVKDRLASARRELDRIIEDKRRHPITYNEYYTTTIQKLRSKRTADKMQEFAEEKQLAKLDNLNSLADALIEQNMENFSATDALDCQVAYYEDELRYFINVITKQIVGRCLVHNLAQDTVSPLTVTDMSDQEVRFVASEPADKIREREFLESRKKMLEAGQKTFRMAMGLLA